MHFCSRYWAENCVLTYFGCFCKVSGRKTPLCMYLSSLMHRSDSQIQITWSMSVYPRRSNFKGLPRGGSNGFPKNTKPICEYINSTICVVFIPPTTIPNVFVGLLYSKLVSIWVLVSKNIAFLIWKPLMNRKKSSKFSFNACHGS